MVPVSSILLLLSYPGQLLTHCLTLALPLKILVSPLPKLTQVKYTCSLVVGFCMVIEPSYTMLTDDEGFGSLPVVVPIIYAPASA